MILTAEHITDPVAYVQENTDLVAYMQPGESKVISGADIDMCVSIPEANHGHQLQGRLERHVSPILGPLYITGEAHGFQAGDVQAAVRWYPSPQAVNTMNEQLGRRPGADVLRFVHSNVTGSKYGSLPDRTYANHLRAGEYAEAKDQTYLFGNYHHYDQNTAVILLPSLVTQKIITVAEKVDDYETKKRKGPARSIGRAFTSSMYNTERVFDKIWENLEGATDAAAIQKAYEKGAATRNPYDEFWKVDRKNIQRFDRRKDGHKQIALIIFEHFAELLPKIEALKQNTYKPPVTC